MSAIEVKNVGKRYRRALTGERRLRRITEWDPRVEKWAVKDVSFSVDDGETFGIIGQNGSGKSTMLRMLSGVTRPTCGSVRVSRKVSGLLTLGEGFHPHLSGEENAATQAIIAGLTRREAVKRLGDIAAFAELEEHMDQPLRTYSEGMRLRLGFAVAVNVNPKILLIDEILAVGDLRFRQKCLEHIDKLHAEGATVVLASHDLPEVSRVCDRAIWLTGGLVGRVGKTMEVVADYERSMSEGMPRSRTHASRGTHIGSGQIEIKDVRLLDSEERETGTVASGAAITVEIGFLAHQRIDEAIFGVSAHSDVDKTLCFDFSTAGDGHLVGPLEGEGSVLLDIDRLDLMAGAYWLNVGAYGSGWHPYDYVWEVCDFDVASSCRGKGVLWAPHRWRME